MADLYDEQFKRRVEMHLLLCDPVSADIISTRHNVRIGLTVDQTLMPLARPAEKLEMKHARPGGK